MTPNGKSAILTLFLLMILGFIMKKRGVLHAKSEQSIVRLIQGYAVPALLIRNVTTQFTKDFLSRNALIIAVSALSILVALFLAEALGRIFQIPPKDRGVFDVMFAFSNTIFVGVPVISGIFGEKGIPYLMLYYLMNTLLFWTLGIYLIGKENGSALVSLSSLKRLFNPAMLGFFIGLVLLYTDTGLPDPLAKSLDYLAQLVTPLSTLYMGSVLADLRLNRAPSFSSTLLILFGRFVFVPATTFLILTALGFSGLLVEVLVVTSALPVMAQASVMAGHYGKDNTYAAFMTALTTFLFLFAVPFYFRFF